MDGQVRPNRPLLQRRLYGHCCLAVIKVDKPGGSQCGGSLSITQGMQHIASPLDMYLISRPGSK